MISFIYTNVFVRENVFIYLAFYIQVRVFNTCYYFYKNIIYTSYIVLFT